MNSLHIEDQEFRQLCEQVAKIAAEYLQELDVRRIAVPERGAEIARILQLLYPKQEQKKKF